MASPIGHNSKHLDEVPMLDAIGRQRWAIMDPRNPLTPIQRGIGHVIACHIEAFGEGVRLSYEYLASCAGLPNRESARYHTDGILKWMGFNVDRNSTRSSYRWSTNVSPEQHIEIYLANKRRQASVRPNPDKERPAVSDSLTENKTVRAGLTKNSADDTFSETVRLNLTNENPSVRLDPQSVRPGTPPNTYKQHAAAAAGQSDSDSTVISLNDDSELLRLKLEPFGEHGSKWARDLAQFLGIEVAKAVDQMEKAARTYGCLNVIEAIREALNTSNVKIPSGLFGSILNRLLNTHGKRDDIPTPKRTNGTTYRVLSMQERCF